MRPLVLVVKLWAQCQNINNAKNMTISSYSLVLMVIHFLQCKNLKEFFQIKYQLKVFSNKKNNNYYYLGGSTPAVLPCLHSIYQNKFSPNSDLHSIDIHEDLHIPVRELPSPNHQSLGELLVQFFKYYTTFE